MCRSHSNLFSDYITIFITNHLQFTGEDNVFSRVHESLHGRGDGEGVSPPWTWPPPSIFLPGKKKLKTLPQKVISTLPNGLFQMSSTCGSQSNYLDKKLRSPRVDEFRFLNSDLVNQKLQKQKCQCSQNVDLNPTNICALCKKGSKVYK